MAKLTYYIIILFIKNYYSILLAYSNSGYLNVIFKNVSFFIKDFFTELIYFLLYSFGAYLLLSY